MRAWWSQLFEPHIETNLRSRYACSLLCLDEPTQNTASGPLSLRSASILSPTSLMACSQVRRFHLPPSSFIGYFTRFSPWAFSRTAEPLAQCAPRLMGESKTGSWRTHTPFSTTASTEHPTEQWVQTVRRTAVSPTFISFAASALPTSENGSWLAKAPAPTVRPERFRNVRRSMVLAMNADTLRVR